MKPLRLPLLLLALGCSPRRDDRSTGPPPDVLEASEGHGYMGSDSIVWESGKPVFTTRGPDGEENRRETSPSADEWRAFWKRIDSLGVGGWEELYSPEVMNMDGTRWSLAIAHEGRHLKSDGYNAFPGSYAELWQALRALEGKPTPP